MACSHGLPASKRAAGANRIRAFPVTFPRGVVLAFKGLDFPCRLNAVAGFLLPWDLGLPHFLPASPFLEWALVTGLGPGAAFLLRVSWAVPVFFAPVFFLVLPLFKPFSCRVFFDLISSSVVRLATPLRSLPWDPPSSFISAFREGCAAFSKLGHTALYTTAFPIRPFPSPL